MNWRLYGTPNSLYTGKARSYLEAALAIAPSRVAHVELAQLLEQLGESALAARHFRAAAVL